MGKCDTPLAACQSDFAAPHGSQAVPGRNCRAIPAFYGMTHFLGFERSCGPFRTFSDVGIPFALPLASVTDQGDGDMDFLALQGIETSEPKTPNNQIRDEANAGLFRDLMARLRQDDTGPSIVSSERKDPPAQRDNPVNRRSDERDVASRTSSTERRERADETRTDDAPKANNEPADETARKTDEPDSRSQDQRSDDDRDTSSSKDNQSSSDDTAGSGDDQTDAGDKQAQDGDQAQDDTEATAADKDASEQTASDQRPTEENAGVVQETPQPTVLDETQILASVLEADNASVAPTEETTVEDDGLVAAVASQGQGIAAQGSNQQTSNRDAAAAPTKAEEPKPLQAAAASQKTDVGSADTTDTDADEPLGGAPKIVREANGGRDPVTRISGANALQAQQQVSGETAGAVTQQQATQAPANGNANAQSQTNAQQNQSAQVTAVAATDDATSGGSQGGAAGQQMDQRDQRGANAEADKALANINKSNAGSGNDLGIAFARAQRPGESFEQTLNRVATPTGVQAVRMDGTATTAVRGSDSVSASFGGPQSNPAVGKASTPVSQAGVRHGVQQHAVAEQVSVRLKTAAQTGDSTVRIQLKPSDLGQVEVKLEIARDGQVRALVVAERPETLDALQRDSRQLERALQDAGLKTDSNSLEFDLKGRDGQNAQAFGKRDENGGQGQSGDRNPANDDQSGDGQDTATPNDAAPSEDGALNMVA